MYFVCLAIRILVLWCSATALPVDLDQTPNESSIVDDFSYFPRKTHKRLYHKRRLPIFRTVQAHSLENGVDSLHAVETDCFPHCAGVLAVGESRSYSIAKGTSTTTTAATETTEISTETVFLAKEQPQLSTANQWSQLTVEETEPKSNDTLEVDESRVVESTSPLPSPISYQTSLTSATSVSRVSFYQAPPLRPNSTTFQPTVYGKPEENYEVDEALSVVTNGRAHGVQQTNKFGYVVEGRDFKKYRVEERTADGFIVGEYGVVKHDDGSLRGVRYTADSTINPRVIYEALVKFLSL